MPVLNLSINYRRPFSQYQYLDGKEGLRHVLQRLQGVMDGSVESDSVRYQWNDTVTVGSAAAYGGQAVGLLVGSSLSGTVGATVGGTAVTLSASGGDTATMTAWVAALQANSTVNLFANASNKLMKLTCTSVVAGTTVQICGLTFTALASGAAQTTPETWSVGGSDTACALALATAINRHPVLAGRVRAVSSAGVLYLGFPNDRSGLAFETIGFPSASTIAINTAKPTAGAEAMIFANVPGIIGNFITVAASGTGASYVTNGTAGQLGLGSGGFTPSYTKDLIP